MRRRMRLACWALLGVAAGCIDGFPSSPPLLVAIPDTIKGLSLLHVTDTVTLEAVFVDGTGARLTDLKVEWQSSDSSVATIAKLTATSGRRDSLRARLVARRSGTASIAATVVHPGFEHTSDVLTVTIGPWGVAQASAWPSVLSATETTTVQIAIPNADSTIVNDLRVQWQSTDESRLRVTRVIPSADPSLQELFDAKRTAIVTALRRGPAEVVVSVERAGFESSEIRGLIQVDTLTIGPTGPWPDTLMVGDSALLSVVVRNSRGDTLAGRQVVWLPRDPSHLTTRSVGPYQAYVRADVRDSTGFAARVRTVGFDTSSTEHNIRIMERWIAVDGGALHTCALAKNHNAFCWGNGDHGALGTGLPLGSPTPEPVLGIGAITFLSVTAGDVNSCGVVTQEIVHCWGWGAHGRLGNGSQADQFLPLPTTVTLRFESVDAGPTTCGIADQSPLYCWGSNDRSQLGTTQPVDTCGGNSCSLNPVVVRALGGDPLYVSTVNVGTIHNCAIANRDPNRDQAFCWGSGFVIPFTPDTAFLLGDTVFSSKLARPVAPPLGSVTPQTFKTLSAGESHTCAIGTNGTTYCWGRNNHGQLGTGAVTNERRPRAVSGGYLFDSITVGSSHTCALTASREAYCWGANDWGQLGVSPVATVDVPTPTRVLGDLSFVALSAGYFHTCGVTSNGVIYCWGRNGLGQLGTRLPMNRCTSGGLTEDCSRFPLRVSEP